MKVIRMDHLVITTSRLDACLAFYSALGFTVRQSGSRHELLSERFKINVHQHGSELSPHALFPTPGSADFCFEVEGDLAQVRAELAGKGYLPELEKSIRQGFFGKMCSLYYRDPDGNLVEISAYSA